VPDRSGGSQPSLATQSHGSKRALLPLTLTALGVVYGDIGTSPLYALRECFRDPNALAVTSTNVLGKLSLIILALVQVVYI
jgi:KUP system potassium uptake protein